MEEKKERNLSYSSSSLALSFFVRTAVFQQQRKIFVDKIYAHTHTHSKH